MDRRQAADLDRHITGDGGEDSVPSDDELESRATEASWEVLNWHISTDEFYAVNVAKDAWLTGYAAAREDERRAAYEAVQAMIQPGPLPGNGCDRSAQRNGIILAANLLAERWGGLKDDDPPAAPQASES